MLKARALLLAIFVLYTPSFAHELASCDAPLEYGRKKVNRFNYDERLSAYQSSYCSRFDHEYDGVGKVLDFFELDHDGNTHAKLCKKKVKSESSLKTGGEVIVSTHDRAFEAYEKCIDVARQGILSSIDEQSLGTLNIELWIGGMTKGVIDGVYASNAQCFSRLEGKKSQLGETTRIDVPRDRKLNISCHRTAKGVSDEELGKEESGQQKFPLAEINIFTSDGALTYFMEPATRYADYLTRADLEREIAELRGSIVERKESVPSVKAIRREGRASPDEYLVKTGNRELELAVSLFSNHRGASIK